MNTDTKSDHIWDMLKRQSTKQLTARHRLRGQLRRFSALSGKRRYQR